MKKGKFSRQNVNAGVDVTRAKGDCSGDIWRLREPLAILAGGPEPEARSRSTRCGVDVRSSSQRSLHIKPQPLLGSHLFGPRLIDIGSDELVQRLDDLLVFVGTTLGSFAG